MISLELTEKQQEALKKESIRLGISTDILLREIIKTNISWLQGSSLPEIEDYFWGKCCS